MMRNFKLRIFIVTLALSCTSVHSSVVTSDNGTSVTHHTPTHLTMADGSSPIRIRGRGRAFLRGGRGANRGGRTTPEQRGRSDTPGGGSPIATYLTAAHDLHSTTDDTLAVFTQVTINYTSLRITVKREHVETTGAGLVRRNLSNSPKSYRIITAFTAGSLSEQ